VGHSDLLPRERVYYAGPMNSSTPAPRCIPICSHCDATFQHILKPSLLEEVRGGFQPSPSDMSIIRDDIYNADITLTQLDKELSNLRAAVARLEREREAVVRRQQTCLGLLSPIRRLPPEILRQIFLCRFLSADNLGDPRPPIRRTRSLPVCLTSVCHRWRCVAIDTAELWAYYALCLDTYQS
jgi:hypothetical protein